MSPFSKRGPYVYPTYQEMVVRIHPGAELVSCGGRYEVIGIPYDIGIWFSEERAWLTAYDRLEKDKQHRKRRASV